MNGTRNPKLSQPEICMRLASTSKPQDSSKWPVKAVCDITPCDYRKVMCMMQARVIASKSMELFTVSVHLVMYFISLL